MAEVVPRKLYRGERIKQMETAIEEASELCILDATGDTRLQWSKGNNDEVAFAKKRFAELKADGYLLYKVDKKGKQGEVISAFDPAAERIIAVPRMIGG